MYLMQVTAVGYKPKSQLTGLVSDSPSQLMDKASPNLSTASKSASLPGYNNRGFHGAVYNNTSSQATVTSLYGGSGGSGANALSSFVNKNQMDKSASKVVATDQQPLAGQKKKKWTGWSGFFRRNSKPSSTQQTAPPVHDDTISSDEETGPAQQHHQQHQPTSHSRLVGSPVASGGCHQAKPLTSEEASKKRLFLQHPPRTLSKDRSPVVDSLSPLQSDLSASQTSLSRKERRDAILARAQARRNNHGGTSAGGSSSDEQPDKDQVHQHLRAPSPSSYWRCGGHHQSQESLTSNGSASRAGHAKSRTGRTERYLQRRSRDEDSLRREMQQQQQQQQQQSQSSRHASPSCADWPSTCAQLNPSTSKLPGAPNNQRWLSPVSSSIQGPWGGAAATAAHHHPETGPSNGVQRVVGESPVTLRKPAYSHNNNNNNSPVVGRAQSALVTHPKLSTPPPPPPRNPLKKSYLLQVQSGDQQTGQQPGQQQQLPLHSSSGRPTSFSFGDLSRFGQQQQQQQQHQLSPGPSSLHDYQNVDQDGRLIPTSNSHALHLPVTSPVQRRVLNSSPQQRQQPGSPSGRHHSAFFPSVSAKSPSPFKSPDQERSKPPPWLASPVSAMKQSAASPSAPPVREFWRSKEVQQQKQTPTSTKSARERLAPFHLTGNNGSVSSLNSDLSSPRSRDPGAQHHNNSNSNNAAAISPAGVDCPPFYMATTTGNALNSVNGAAAGTPRRFPLVSNDHNNTNNNQQQQQQQPHHHVRELSQLKPSTDRHLEQAICELEQIYRSLKLDGDEDLLDRAERRDLPTVHQQLAQLPYSAVSAASVCSGSESGGDPLGGHGITSDLDTMMNWSISGSFENLGSASTTTSTTNTEHQRVRAPPNRRSAVPDKVADDMAVRRLAAAARKSQCNDPQAIAAQSGSYLLLSPSVTAAMATDSQDLDGSGCSRSGSFSPDEPDVIYDDVAYRQIRQANKSLRVAEPQPPFGIPLGPVTPASPSDYLHSSVTPEQMDLRPLLHPTKYPDLVRDDLAFRNLRKDAGQLQLPPGPVNTDKLDDLLQYVPQQSATKSLKKKRAIRSLSANIGQLIRMDAARPSGGGGVVDFNRADDDQEEEDERYIGFNPFDSRAQSLSDLLDESAGYPTNNNTYNSNNSSSKCAKTPRAVKQRSGLKRVGKSVEPDDVDAIIQRQVRPMASWVERAHLSDVPASSTETITNVTERVPALAKLYPTSALAATRKSEVVAPVQQQQQQPPDLEMDHLISELSECSVAAPLAIAPAAPGAGRKRQVDSSGLQLALKPPTGAGSFSSEVPGASSTSPAASLHCWEESPLFQSTPQFHFTQQQQQRSASPANSSDSGQVSCCAREVRQILHHQIRQEEKERERLVSMASSSSGVASKGRQPTTTTATTAAATTTATPTARKSSGGGRKMSNNNETGNGSAPVTAVEKRDERIARYKEERRKQLQAARHQAGSAAAAGTLGLGHDHSSSSEDLPHEEQSYAKYKHRKQMQKQQLESRAPEEHPPATANVSDLVNCNVSSSGIKRFIKRESPLLASEDNNGMAPVRINRAARLRAAATSATPPPVEDKSVQRVKRLSVPLLEMPPIDPSDGQAAGPVVDNGGQPGGVVVVLRQKLPSSSSSSSLQAGSREKDKSTKRKSNLNRALTDEQVLATGQIESQEETGKRIRRRRTAELVAGSAASSAETDISSSIDNSAMMLQRRTESTVQHPPTRQSPQRDPAADLRANLRKTSQPPAFIRPPVPEIHNISESLVTTTPVTADNSASFPAPPPPPVSSSSSVPWRTGKVASAEKLPPPPPPPTTTTEHIKTEDLTARIEALTAMAHQTVAKVDRLTGGTPDRELVTNGAHPPPSGGAGSVKAVATKLLNRVANVQPAPSSPTALPRRPASKIEPPNASVNSNCSPAVKLLPAATAGSAQQQGKLQQPQPQSPSSLLSKNRPAVNPIEKATGASCSPAGVAAVPPTTRANSANASSSSSSLARKKSADQSLEKTQNKVAAEPAASGSGGPSSSVKAVQGILKKKVEGGSSAGAGGGGGGGAAAVVESTSVRIRPEVSAPELYPILRVEEEVVSTPLDPVSILKKRFEEPTELSAVAPVALDGIAEPHSILKRPLSRDGSAESGRSQSPDPINSILKRASLTSSPGSILLPDQAAALSSNNSEPRPILKKRPSTDEPGADGGPRPILKKKSSTEDEHELAAHKPILKSGRRTSQVAERAPEAADQPEEPHPAEGGEEPRQLSIAERISSIESQTNPPVSAASAAPWRLQSRPVNSVPVNNSASESPISRRKSLDHVIESNRSAGLVEAVNRHVVEAHAHTVNGTRTSPDILTQPEAEVAADEFDPSKLSLRDRVKLFDRPLSVAGPASALPPKRPSRKVVARFLTQPVTSREVRKALHLGWTRGGGPSTAKPAIPTIEISQELCDEETKPKENEEEVASASGLDRIRGILRRKSSDNTTEMKSILRSKSPSSSGEQPKSILKRHSPDVNEMERPSSSSSSNSSSEEFPVPAEHNLAAQLLNVEMESKNQSIDPAGSVVQPTTEETTVISQTDPAQPTPTTAGKQQQQQQAKPSPTEPSQSSQSLAQSTVRRETETIILESEGSSSGTETTTTVTFRLGGGSAGTTTVKQSQTKIKTNKIAKMDQQETSESSVASRLAALQKSGDTEWRKRISKPVPGSPSSPSATTEVDEAATNSDGDIPTTKSSSSIADRLKVLETAQKGWKNRVHEPDAARFTVAGKMAGQQQQRPVSVHVLSSEMIKISAGATDQKIKVPKPVPLRVKAGADGSAGASDSSPSTDDVKPPFNRSTSDPSSTPSRLIIPGVGKVTSRIVSVPRPDNETFTSFFAASSWSLAQSSSTPSVAAVVSSSSFADITDEDFERIAGSRDLVVVEKRSVNVQRRKHNTSRNPIKSLILRPDMLRDEYEEVDTGVAEREVQRIKLEKLAQNSHLAVEALAGLASKEDFAAISLKSAKETGGGGGDQPNNKAGSTYLMQVKGRRQIQTRLVQPTYQSVNSGDCYILVTPTDVIQFIGRYSNVIERSRSTEVAGRIVSKKDLGSARASHVQIVEEDKVGTNSFYGSSKRFWAALGRTDAEQSVAPAGPPEEDELYESAITSTNTVWQLSGDHLEPCEQHWGTILQTEILDPNKVMVFDFGSEMYVWSGKMAPLEVRKRAMRLAKELWDQGYDYSECAINPVFQRHTSAELSKGQQRPDWTLLRSAKQHMEPVLFREKFFDWPDKSGLIRVKNQDSDDNKTASGGGGGGGNDISSLEPYDAQLMLDYELDDPDLELEGAHLGRGVEYYDPAERRLQQISTLSVKVWHLADYEKVLLDQVSRGQFHSRDTYIIRWQYRITVTGKDLKGQPSVHGLLGRDRFCYFIWHGAQAPPTDQGASALKTVELDEERGPHVRVQQGHEPPAFLAIFQGRMTIQSGKRGETDESERWRLYIVRGEVEEEAHLLQVRRCVAALRSRGSLVLVNLSTGTVFLWHGAKSLKHTRQVASAAATALKEHRPPELNVRTEANLAVKEQYEGAESREFWEGLGHKSRVADRSLYLSLAEKPMENRYDYTARLFHLTSWTGQFRADEVAPSSRLPQLPCPYPFVQEDLYGANQPTLFMLDNEHEVWLWQGWWPDLPDTENTNTGSGKLRLAVERRCAMETVMEYCRLKGDQLDRIPPPAYLVSAGLEPLAFTSLFPYWTADERVAQLNIQEGRSPGELQPIQDVLERLKRTTYTMSELQVRPPPEGVDPTRLESYLKDDDFQETMGMAKTEFYALPAWRQTQLRKETGLF